MDWNTLSTEEKLARIKEVVKEEIQPFVEMDGGGIEVLALENDREVVIAYHGACAYCPCATGSTLHNIEEVLRSKIHPDLVVRPDPSSLHF
jgi:NifU-like protein